MLNLRQLETFYWTAKLRSFTAAAKRLGMTQSAVSVRIQELENQLGAEIFDRRHHAPKVTAKGRELLRYAERILRLCVEATGRISNADASPEVIRIGFAEVISMTWLPKLIRAIHARYPGSRLELHEALAQELFDSLKRGALDLVLGAGTPQDHEVHAVSLGKVRFEWMASPSLGLPKQRLKPGDLQKWPVIALARESVHHKTIDDWFSNAGKTRRKFDTCKSIGVASTLAKAGFGITILPVRCYATEIKRGNLVVVSTNPKLPALEFFAFNSADSLEPAFREVAKLAAEASDFER